MQGTVAAKYDGRLEVALDYARNSLSALFAVLVPIALYYSNSFWLKFSYTRENAIFEYFGFSAALVLIVNLIIDTKRAAQAKTGNLIPIVLFGLTAFTFLIWFSEYSVVSYDYSAYQTAVQALLKGQSPYGNSPAYIYPPLLAQVMFFTYKTVQWVSVRVFSTQMDSKEYLFLVFYIFQVIQYGLTLVSFGLTYLFARTLEHTKLTAALLVSLLFLANVPLFRNFRMNQVNLWILVVVLLAILFVDRFPILDGAAVALGTHIKLYPAIILLPWLLSKKWLAVFSAIFSGIAILVVQLFVSNGVNQWIDFTRYLQSMEMGVAFRNNSLHSLAQNLAHLVVPGNNPQALSSLVIVLTATLTLFMVVWIAVRCWQRTRAHSLTDQEKFLGNFMDAIILMFLISPSVWDHHLVAAIPIAIWAISVCPNRLIGLVGLGVVLLFWVPTFDVFFFSYVRLAGILMLMVAIPPERAFIPKVSFEQNFLRSFVR